MVQVDDGRFNLCVPWGRLISYEKASDAFSKSHFVNWHRHVAYCCRSRAGHLLLAQPASAVPQAVRPFRLPFAEPPGSNTWLVGQPYGNTTSAYRQRFTTHGASGGIHFGLDLSAPYGSEIVAIAAGVVFAGDGPYTNI